MPGSCGTKCSLNTALSKLPTSAASRKSTASTHGQTQGQHSGESVQVADEHVGRSQSVLGKEIQMQTARHDHTAMTEITDPSPRRTRGHRHVKLRLWRCKPQGHLEDSVRTHITKPCPAIPAECFLDSSNQEITGPGPNFQQC